MSTYAVICRACSKNLYEGDTQPADGQTFLTDYADSVAGATCPSGIATCPQKSAAIAAARKLLPAAIVARIAAVEAKVGITPASQG